MCRLYDLHGDALSHRIGGDVGGQRLLLGRLQLVVRLMLVVAMWMVLLRMLMLPMGGSMALMVGRCHLAGSHRVAAIGAHRGGGGVAGTAVRVVP